MRKLILTQIFYQTGDLKTVDYRLVVVNHQEGEVEEDLLRKAAAQVEAWFPKNHPESNGLGIVPKATVGEPIIQVDINSSKSFTIGGIYRDCEIPSLENDEKSVDVLIDIDGYRTTFRVGYYDMKMKRWELYDKTRLIDLIDLDDMRWQHINIENLKKPVR
jgi:hypothetical protein